MSKTPSRLWTQCQKDPLGHLQSGRLSSFEAKPRDLPGRTLSAEKSEQPPSPKAQTIALAGPEGKTPVLLE